MRLAGLVKGGYYPTPMRCVDLVANLVMVQKHMNTESQEAIRILDPCCGPGDACERLAARLASKTKAEIRTYGVELEQERAQKARDQMDFALSSDLFQAMIANNAFQVLYLNPPYDFDSEDKRVEHAFLMHCTRYLVGGGLLMLVVPRHRLSVSAKYLAANYDRLECRRFPDPEYDNFDQVILMGNRRMQPEVNKYGEDKILNWARCPTEQMKTLEDETAGVLIAIPTGERTDLLFTIRSVKPGAGRSRGQEIRTLDQSDNQGQPVAVAHSEGPAIDAPETGPHGDAGRRWVPGQPLPGGQRQANPGQGPDRQEDGDGQRQRGRGGLAGPDVHHHPDAGPGHREIPGRADPEQEEPANLHRGIGAPFRAKAQSESSTERNRGARNDHSPSGNKSPGGRQPEQGERNVGPPQQEPANPERSPPDGQRQ